MIKFTLAAVRALARSCPVTRVRAYTVPCGTFGRRATVWDCAVSNRLIEKGRWSEETRAALLLAGYGVAVFSPRSHFPGADKSDLAGATVRAFSNVCIREQKTRS